MSRLLDVEIYSIASCWDEKDNKGFSSCTGYTLEELRKLDIVILTFSYLAVAGGDSDSRPDEAIDTELPSPAEKIPGSVPLSVDWFRIVLDEAHGIRNRSTKIFQILCSPEIAGNAKRMYVTGTPYWNNYDEISVMLAFLRVPTWSDEDLFKACFTEKTGRRSTRELTLAGRKHDFLVLTFLDLMLRRKIEDAGVKLPEPVYKNIELMLDNTREVNWEDPKNAPREHKTEAETQEMVRKSWDESFVDTTELNQSNDPVTIKHHLWARMNSFHWAAHRAYVGTKEEDEPDNDKNVRKIKPEWRSEMEDGDNCWSTKTRAIIEKVKRRLNEDEGKILIFDHFVPNVELLEIALQKSNIPCVEIHGLVKSRSQKIEQFKDPDGPRLMVATRSTLGIGHNLTVATTVMLGTPDYTPSVEEQAIARVLRIGYKRSLHIVRFIAKNSIDIHVTGNFQQPKIKQATKIFELDRLLANIGGWKDVTLQDFTEFMKVKDLTKPFRTVREREEPTRE